MTITAELELEPSRPSQARDYVGLDEADAGTEWA